MKKISEEDFDAWRENPITRKVFGHFKEVASQAETHWLAQLRGEISPDPRILQLIQVELRAKLEFIEDMISIELKDIQENEQQGATVVGKGRR